MDSERLVICEGCKNRIYGGYVLKMVPGVITQNYVYCIHLDACRRAVQLTEQRVKQEAADGAGD
jgi:hypothetical protein